MIKQRKTKQPTNADTLFKLPVPIPEPPRLVNVKPTVPDLSINCEDDGEEVSPLELNFDYNRRSMETGHNNGGSNNSRNVDILKEIARINQRLKLNGLRDNHPAEETKRMSNSKANGKETSPKEKSASRFSESPSSSGKLTSKDLVYDSVAINSILRKQNEKLDRIAEQVQLILSFTMKKEPEKRSVGTMTSSHGKLRTDKSVTPRRERSDRSRKKKISDSGLITSESESRSDGSELRSRSKNCKMREELYEKLLRNIDNRQHSNSRSDQSDSYCSISPPRVNRSLPTPPRYTDDVELISKLAEKYLSNDKNDVKTCRRGLNKKTSLSEGEDHNLRRSKRHSRRQPVTVSDFTEEASIGVTNYFEKYHLYD